MKISKYKEIIILIFLSLIINFSTINSVPVLDRDEARYVQSTKQMIEANNYNSIKFQEDFRSKKPIGIYWLQALSVNLLSHKEDQSTSKDSLIKIWKYRVVSAIFSFISCMALFILSSKFFDRNIAFFGALVLQCTLLFTIESHIAKTDAVLLTFSIFAMVILYGYYRGTLIKKYDLYFFIFWISLGLSFLIKGPILLLIVFITSIFVVLIKKQANWLLNTNPFLGLLIVGIIIVSWFLTVPIEEQSSFINEGFKKDLMYKIISVQEKHRAFFGAHTLSVLLLFFPMSLFLFPSIYNVIKNYKLTNNFFLISWIMPNLLILELIPTKLPHYTLPIYPAIALLIGDYIYRKSRSNYYKKNILEFCSSLFYLIAVLIISFLIYFGIKGYSSSFKNPIMFSFFIFLVLSSSILIYIKHSIIKSFYYQILIACFTSIMVFGFILPKLDKVWITDHLFNIISGDNNDFESKNIALIGYNEPSAIFMLGTDIKILKSLNKDFFEKRIYKYIIVEKKYILDFYDVLKKSSYEYILLEQVKGFNMAKSKWVETSIFKLKE